MDTVVRAGTEDAVDATARMDGFAHPWDDDALTFADRYDFVARAGDLAAAGRPAVRLVVGGDDDAAGFVRPPRDVTAALAAAYGDHVRVDLHVVPGMGHPLAEEPGVHPVPRTVHARRVDTLATEWFARFLH